LRANGPQMIVRLNEILYPSLKLPAETTINLRFFYLNLARPDVLFLPSYFPFRVVPGVFLFFAALTQFLTSKMMSPPLKTAQALAKKTPGKEDDLATLMQQQALYLFPLMTIFIGLTFPSGLVLYWLVFSVFQMGQQYLTGGWGGLEPWLKKLRLIKE